MNTKLFIPAIAVVMLSGCSDSNEPSTPTNVFTPIELTAPQSRATEQSNDFGWRLFGKICETGDPKENFTLSPLSVSQALYMLSNGASGNTRSQILDALGVSSIELADLNAYSRKLTSALVSVDNTATLNISNSFWTQLQGMAPGFEASLLEWYDAETGVVTEDGMVDAVNAWCNEKTNGLIPQIMTSPSQTALVNALYFKGEWQDKFDKAKTKKDRFYDRDGNAFVVDFMSNTIKRSDYAQVNGLFKAVSLPMGNGAYSFYIVLPEQGKTTDECVAYINENGTDIFAEGLGTEIDIKLPKFKATCNLDLVKNLKRMGMTDAFDDEIADFSDMGYLPTTRFCIRNIDHSTSLEIDEDGAVAAAATVVKGDVYNASAGKDFIVNRPFVYYIAEKSTSSVIFLGKFERP